jgi:hypothetical protein
MKFRRPSVLILLGACLLLTAVLAAGMGQRGLMLLSAGLALAVFTAEGFVAVGLNRVGIALLAAPLSSCVVIALSTDATEWSFWPAILYAYFAGLIGIPAYFVFRKLRWLSFMKVAVGGVVLGGLMAPLLLQPPEPSFVLRCASLGALSATVFWSIAYFGRSRSEA